MSNATPTDMDSFLPLITTTDTKMRLLICSKLLTYLSDAENSIVCSDIGFFIDTLVNWLQSSNFKVIQIDLDILSELISRMKSDFQPYLSTLVPPLVDKLGDSKDTIRERSLNLFKKLVEYEVLSVQSLFDRIGTMCFAHKNSNVREQIMFLLVTVLNEYGASSLGISKLVPSIVKLLSDPNASVRSTAFETLCNVYKHVGERLRIDLQKKYSIPHNKLPALMTKFDEIKASSDDGLSSIFQSLRVEDEPDQSERSSVKSSFSSVSASRPPITPSSLSLSSATKSKISSLRKPNGTSSQAGAVDEEYFLANFEDVASVQIYSSRDLEDNLNKCRAIIENVNEDWSKRADTLKKIRSLIVAGGLNYEEFHVHLNLMLPSFHTSLKDLRSQIVREACITVAFLSKSLSLKFDHFAESVLSNLINLIQNSAKVIASSGLICIRFILQNTHAPRLVPIIANSLNSKSKEIRKACCEFINLILQTWHTHSIERHVSALQEAIKKGITDADADARAHARNAFKGFSQHFPEQGESLKNSLDYPYRKMLSSNSNSGSNSSLSRIPAMSGISVRSNSAIDLQAVKRAKTRAHYAAMARQKFGSGVSLPRSKNVATPPTSEQRVSRTKSRISVSQPTSRSGSPSSRLSYTNYLGSSGSISRTAKRTGKPLSAQKILQQSREAETELADALGNCDTTPYSFRPSSRNLYRSMDDHSDESETSSICSEQSFDSYRRPSDSMSWNGSQHRLYRDTREMCKDISEIIANCENAHWNERREGLQSLQYYVQDGNKLALSDLKKIMEIFTKIFNDPHIKVFSLFLDSLNELIRSHNEDLCFCLHLLLTRLFNKLGTDLLNSVHSKIMKTLDIVFESFPPDLQIQSVFRFLVDPTQTPNTRVKLATLNYLIKLTTVVDPCSAFNSSINDSNKDYASMALVKMVSWTITENLKVGPELRRLAKEAVLALFNLNPAQVTRRFASMSKECQEAAAAVCKSRSGSLNSNNEHHEPPVKNNVASYDYPDISSVDFQMTTSTTTTIAAAVATAAAKDNDVLKTYIDELPQCTSEISKKKLLTKITALVNELPSDVIIQHFKLLLSSIISLLGESEPSSTKEQALYLLQAVVKRKTVTFLLKNFSDLIITRVIAVCSDPGKDVVKAAENCAIMLSTHLPAESVVRVIVPLITSEAAPVKLVAIKMLTRLVECSDDTVVIANIDQIMNVLLVAYDDTESSVRKAAVFCMVALHKQSDEMKTCLVPYINKLQGAKLKLLQLYIRRAEQGSSMPTSPKNS